MLATELIRKLENAGTGKEKIIKLQAAADIDDRMHADELIRQMPSLGMPEGTVKKASELIGPITASIKRSGKAK